MELGLLHEQSVQCETPEGGSRGKQCYVKKCPAHLEHYSGSGGDCVMTVASNNFSFGGHRKCCGLLNGNL